MKRKIEIKYVKIPESDEQNRIKRIHNTLYNALLKHDIDKQKGKKEEKRS